MEPPILMGLLIFLMHVFVTSPCGLSRGALDLSFHLAKEVLDLTSVTLSVDSQCVDALDEYLTILPGSLMLTVVLVGQSENTTFDPKTLALIPNLHNSAEMSSSLHAQLDRDPFLHVLLEKESIVNNLPLRLDSQVQ